MFTGLVQDRGHVEAVDQTDEGARVRVRTGLGTQIDNGDSVAVQGVCLTATAVHQEVFTVDVTAETLRRSTLGALAAGAPVNLELPLRATDRLGGHVVQGHVDGVGEVVAVGDEGFSRRVWIEPPPELLRYVVQKGSIAVAGVSLTVAEVTDDRFAVALIPETLERTTLGTAAPGDRVNIEVDVLAKHVEKLLEGARA
ncbi:MAG TPA: riboflavin synthase [Solirubrobacteraceae bacterium]|jgi:riboflavin synthase|nr:riboflavin synthase [Solirubrobacteraceae bacterium]